MDTENTQTAENTNDIFVTHAVNLAVAFVGNPNNRVDANAMPEMVSNFHAAIARLSQPEAPAAPAKQEPAVSIRASIKPEYLICLEDGQKMKMLKRYLRQRYNLTPDQYRAKWGLAKDYPMVAPNYAEQRRDLAKKIGLGTSRTRSAEGRGGRKADTGAEAVSENTTDNSAASNPAPARTRKSGTASATSAKAGGRGKGAAQQANKGGEATPAKRGRGRPKGSTNAPKAANA